MSKVAVVYWFQTGNTQTMAEAIADAASTEATEWSEFSADKVADFDALAFGCPAMGSEELDPDFEALWNECVPALGDKPVALFGSYDWGTGEWMQTWEEAAKEAGVNVISTQIAQLKPDEDILKDLTALGKQLSA